MRATILTAAVTLFVSGPCFATQAEVEAMLVQKNGFTVVDRILGCDHKSSDDQVAEMFEALKGKLVVATGEVTKAAQGEIWLKVRPTTLIGDLIVTMADKRSTYDLEKGRTISVRFNLKTHGGCLMPFSGNNGVIIP